jgi:hypothetical protein
VDIFEVEKQETVSRKELATRLRRLANMLSSDDEEISFERGASLRSRATSGSWRSS